MIRQLNGTAVLDSLSGRNEAFYSLVLKGRELNG